MGLNVLGSDNFTRADSNPIDGSWESFTSWYTFTQPLQIISNLALLSAVGSTNSMFNGFVWPTNQWAAVTVASMQTGVASPGVGVWLRATDGVGGYIALFSEAPNLFSIYSFVPPNTFTALASVAGPSVMNPGDVVMGQVQGQRVSLLYNGAEQVSVDDPTFAGGMGGAYLGATNNVDNVEISLFQGGSFTIGDSMAWTNRHRRFVNKVGLNI